jgi:hypothetical protein
MAKKGTQSRKTQKKQSGGKKTRKLSKWNLFTKKIYAELKKKNKDATFGQALAEASNRKSEMKSM